MDAFCQTIVDAGYSIRTLSFYGLNYLEWVGLIVTVLVCGYQVPRILMTVYSLWLGPLLGRSTDLTKMGQWAVVTGATDGLGKAYCEELAKKGLNIVLVSRTLSKLDKVAEELSSQYKVKTRVITADFTHGPGVYKYIKNELEGLEIGTLINNVGMWYPYAEFFGDLPDGDNYCEQLIYCNVFSVTMMTRLVLPQMVGRGKGVIVNVGSLSGILPTPLMTVYAATKAYLDNFSQGLSIEYQHRGITVQTVLPAYMATKMSRVSTPSWTSPSPRDYARKAVQTIGLERRTAVHLAHRLTMQAFSLYAYFFPAAVPKQGLSVTLYLRNNSKTRRRQKEELLMQKQEEEKDK